MNQETVGKAIMSNMSREAGGKRVPAQEKIKKRKEIRGEESSNKSKV